MNFVTGKTTRLSKAVLRQTYLFERAVCAGAKGSNFFTNFSLHRKYQGKNKKVKEGKGSVIM